MAPPTFLGGEPAAMPAQFWDSATGEENLVVAVAPPVSVRAVSARLPRATSRFVCVEAAQPELSVAALDVKPVAFIGPESAVVALCTRPGPIRFAIAVGSSTEPRTLAARLAATNPDILVTALPSTLSAEETVQKAAAFVADAVEAMGVWAALYGSRNVVGLDGIANLRDFGGYPTRDGKRVRRGVMYRSADLSPAPESSFHALHWELGVSHIHDLRSNPELAKKPYDVPEKLALGGKVIRYHTPVNKEEDYSPEALALRFGLYVGISEHRIQFICS